MERPNDLPNPENSVSFGDVAEVEVIDHGDAEGMERPNDLPNPENSVSFGDVAEVEVIDHGDAE